MPRPAKQFKPVVDADPTTPDAAGIVQIKVWLIGISPMVWRRVLVPSACTLRELHGVIQVAMGWEGITCTSSASGPTATDRGRCRHPRLTSRWRRCGCEVAWFTYEYDLNISWRHEVRIEGHLTTEPGKIHPRCTAGDGACPPEDCGGPRGYLAGLDEASSLDALEDLHTMAESLREVVLENRLEVLGDQKSRWRLKDALERGKARECARGQLFSRQSVNTRLRKDEHLVLMHQQW